MSLEHVVRANVNLILLFLRCLPFLSNEGVLVVCNRLCIHTANENANDNLCFHNRPGYAGHRHVDSCNVQLYNDDGMIEGVDYIFGCFNMC